MTDAWSGAGESVLMAPRRWLAWGIVGVIAQVVVFTLGWVIAETWQGPRCRLETEPA